MAAQTLICGSIIHGIEGTATVWRLIFLNDRQVTVHVRRLNVVASASAGQTLCLVAKCPVVNNAPQPGYEPVILLDDMRILANREAMVQVGIVSLEPLALFGEFVVDVRPGHGLFVVDRAMIVQEAVYPILWSFSGIVSS
jgi:hypothetical protein